MAFDLIMPPIVGLVGLLVAFVIYNVMSKHDAIRNFPSDYFIYRGESIR